MNYEDKLKDYRERVLAKINEKAKIKAQKKLEETIDKYLGEDDGQNLGDC